MAEYRVSMIHSFRSIQDVEAKNEEQAKEKAWSQSWDEDERQGIWEEIDTEYYDIQKLNDEQEEN